MVHSSVRGPYYFRGYLPTFLLVNGALLGAGAACLAAALADRWLWWAGVIVCIAVATTNALRYANEAVIVHGFEVALRKGTYGRTEVSFELWKHDLRISQGLHELLLDIGTVSYRSEHGPVTLRGIANIRALRSLIAERRRQATALLMHDRPRDGERPGRRAA